jgi:hypothetical protein
VAVVLALGGLVALVQGIAWSAAAAQAPATTRRERARGRVGMLLAPIGLSLVGFSLLLALVPGFFG